MTEPKGDAGGTSWWKRAVALPVWGLILIVVASIAIGAAGGGGTKNESARVAELEEEVEDLEQELAVVDEQLFDAEDELERAQADGESDAERQAADDEAAERAFIETQRRKNTVPAGGGVFAIGADINPGQWRTAGPDVGSFGCYYAILNDLNGTIDSIATNNILQGPGIAELPGGKFFETNGCAEWTRG